jgi:hypothetical protein
MYIHTDNIYFDLMQFDQMHLRVSRPKCSLINILWKLLHISYHGKCIPIIWDTFVIFTKTTQRKQSPNRQKFAQSGHPDLMAPWKHKNKYVCIHGYTNEFKFDPNCVLSINLRPKLIHKIYSYIPRYTKEFKFDTYILYFVHKPTAKTDS